MRIIHLLGAFMLLLLVGSGTASASVLANDFDPSGETGAITNQVSAPIIFSGSNDQATQTFYCGLGRLDVSWTAGDGYFSIWLVDESGENIDLLASQIDGGAGSSVTHVSQPGNYRLKISARSPWTVTLPATLETTTATTFSGSNDLTTPAFMCGVGRLNVEWTAGDGYFSIWLVDESGDNVDLLASQVDGGPGSTVTHISSPGYYMLKISARSPWTITLPATLQTTQATTFSGSNSQVTPAFSSSTGQLDVAWTAGDGYFSIWLVDVTGENVDLLASQVDGGAGSTVTRITSPGYYMLKISASSPWTVTLPTFSQPVQPIQTPVPTSPPVIATPLPVVSTPAPVVMVPTPAPVVVTPTLAPITTPQSVVPPVAGPTLNPSSSWGKRYAVGNPGSFLGTRFSTGTAPTGTSGRRTVTTTDTVLKPGSRSYGITPPASGSFVRWYPAARWQAGIK